MNNGINNNYNILNNNLGIKSNNINFNTKIKQTNTLYQDNVSSSLYAGHFD